MKIRTILIGGGIGLALLALLGGGWLLGGQPWNQTWCQSGFGMTGNYRFPWEMHTFGGGLLMFLFWGLIIGGIALLVVGLGRQSVQRDDRGESPLDILNRRYASGEIDHEEFERMKELLSS
jgi:putative membrane protein